MPADHCFKKWSKVFPSVCELRTRRNIEKPCIIDFLSRGDFAAAPRAAGIDGEASPAIEVVSESPADAARGGLDLATDGKKRSRELSGDDCTGIKERVSAVQFPLGRKLVLSCGERAERAQE